VLQQQVIHHPGAFVRCGDDGLLRSAPRPHRAEVGPKGRVGACHGLRGLEQGRRGTCTTFSVRARKTLPPEMALWGASPRHEQKGLPVGNRLMAVPISALRVWALEAESPVTATRATPVRRTR
jgi:hypothetical protein